MMEDFEMEIETIRAEEVARFIYMRLLEMGYAPSNEEVEDIADIFGDLLYEFDLIDEVVEIEIDEEE